MAARRERGVEEPTGARRVLSLPVAEPDPIAPGAADAEAERLRRARAGDEAAFGVWMPAEWIVSRGHHGHAVRSLRPGYFTYRSDRVWVTEAGRISESGHSPGGFGHGHGRG